MDLEDDPGVTLYSETVRPTYDVIVTDDPLVRVEALSSLDLANPVPFRIEEDIDVAAILNLVLHGHFSVLIMF